MHIVAAKTVDTSCFLQVLVMVEAIFSYKKVEQLLAIASELVLVTTTYE